MRDGSTIRDVCGTAGGTGVYVKNGRFIMNGGTIKNCVHEYTGCGVLLDNPYVYFEMNGGIVENKIGLCGGGVSVHIGATFLKTGGIIRNNVARPYMSFPSFGNQVSNGSTKYLDLNVYENHNIDSRLDGAEGGWVE